MNQIWPIGTEIWFRMDGRTDGRNGRTDGRSQNYIASTSSGDKKGYAWDKVQLGIFQHSERQVSKKNCKIW